MASDEDLLARALGLVPRQQQPMENQVLHQAILDHGPAGFELGDEDLASIAEYLQPLAGAMQFDPAGGRGLGLGRLLMRSDDEPVGAEVPYDEPALEAAVLEAAKGPLRALPPPLKGAASAALRSIPEEDRHSPSLRDTEEQVKVNLSALTHYTRPEEEGPSSFIPGLQKLNDAAAEGDLESQSLLSHIAHESATHLLSGIPGADVVKSEEAVGLFGGVFEAARQITIEFDENSRAPTLAALAHFARNFNQDGVYVRKDADPGTAVGRTYGDGSYNTFELIMPVRQSLSRKEKEQLISQAGLYGATFTDDEATVYYVGDPDDQEEIDGFIEGAHRLADSLGAGGSDLTSKVSRLWTYGDSERIPYREIEGDFPKPAAKREPRTVRRIASLVSGREITPAQQAKRLTESQSDFQTRVSDAYESMKVNNLDDPKVQRAYRELEEEVLEQYSMLPIRVEMYPEDGVEPYPSSKAMREDVLTNNHLWIFPTTKKGFGPKGADFDAKNHPLLRPTKYKDIRGRKMVVNDLLRAVHDYYAHTLSPVQFGVLGEEAAWRNHMMMTKSPWARWALTSETRGQNSWVNFGPMGEHNRANPAETVFAEQKADLLPVEFAKTGDPELDAELDAILSGDKPLSISTPESLMRRRVKKALE